MTETRSRMDALGTARTFIRLVRMLEHQPRLDGDTQPLTLTELGVLGQIDRCHTLPSAIARALALDPGRITRITDHLYGLGYIQRQADPDDRRRCRLLLTDAGVERLERGRSHYSDAMESILRGLSERELAALRLGTEGLARVLENPVR